ncbi:hypothetical protein GXW82_32345 [Streptacidiphilus sp. 4-A2]|nr:hypothetical protein [Streptacidiphilus sp. 4-A2]
MSAPPEAGVPGAGVPAAGVLGAAPLPGVPTVACGVAGWVAGAVVAVGEAPVALVAVGEQAVSARKVRTIEAAALLER